MRIVLGIVIGLVAVLAITFVVGLLMPREHTASSRVTLTSAPAQVWPIVRDLSSLVGTWSDLKRVRRVADADGREVWEQNAGGFEMRMIVEEVTEPTRMLTRIDAPPGAAFGGTWTYQVEPAGAGTQVTITENGYVSNPIFRVMMAAMGVHRTADGYLRALGKKLGEEVTAEHVGR
jgi:hypothetical protein